MIHFGTDGWRAVIADTFTFENVRHVTQALADTLLADAAGDTAPSAVVGYDTRFLSDRFAHEAARVLAANGLPVWLTRSDTPTPSVSYNVVAKGAAAGVVITASHNPPRYNGYKVKSNYGGSATDESCKRIEARLQTNLAAGVTPKAMDYDAAVESGIITRFDPNWTYFEHLGTLVDIDLISEAELNIVSDAMWGAGRGAFSGFLRRSRCAVTDIRSDLNPGFGGIHPEPILKHLTALVAAVKNRQADVGLATDGDADRIGAVDAFGSFIDPHHIFALTLRHLVEKRGQRGDVVKTVSTTTMIDRLCQQHGLTLHETPVGFNHIADLMIHNDVLIGGEESGGIGVRGHIPEGDGVLMGLLLLEVMAAARAPLHEIVADLQKQAGPALYGRIDARLTRTLPKAEMRDRLVQSAPTTLAGETVVKVDTLDGVKFKLADGGWLLVRPSGTEPVLRIYAEAPTTEAVNALLEAGSAMGHSIVNGE
ncbi:MAG: phosphoglucomutase/phosphomannomutase family protein [Chloroflexi bacterium]|nr:phosphoglucomutase/phosphomannomutase family protein [Chloroflexota bacterium]